MSTAMWKLEKDLCRCCHAEGSFKHLSDPCFQLGQEEIYSDMLQDCLDIKAIGEGEQSVLRGCVVRFGHIHSLEPHHTVPEHRLSTNTGGPALQEQILPMTGVLSDVTYTICESCVVRLRDASNFKRQVQDCEERFKEMYSKNLIKGYDVKDEPMHDSDDLKQEFQSIDEDDDDAFMNFDDDADDSQEDQPLTIDEPKVKGKGKAKPKPKSKKTPARKTKTKGKPIKLETETLTEAAVSGEKKKGLKPRAPKFRLRDDDFTREGDAYLCSRCDKRYYKIFSLRFHIKTKHYKIPRFICQYCSKEFMTLAPLTVHKLEEHNVDDRFKCNACKGTFNTKIQLRKHINNFHMLGEKYKCEFCEYESFSFEGMYKHKFKHRTVKDYHCKFCRKSFLRKTTLDLHERIHTGDRRKVCSVCGQAFVQKASLNYHMTKYHPEVNF